MAPTLGKSSQIWAPRRTSARATTPAVLDLRGCAEFAQARLVHVQRAGADGVAARQRDDRTAAARDERPEHTHRRAQPRHRAVIRLRADLSRNVDDDGVAVDRYPAPQAAQHVGHQRDVEDLRAVGERRRAFGEQRRRHQLEHAVLGADHVHRAHQPGPAGHREMLCHDGRRYLPVSGGLRSPHGRAPDQDLHEDRRRRHHGAGRLQPRPQDRRPARGLRRHRRGQRRARGGGHPRRALRGRAGRRCGRCRTICSTSARTCAHRSSTGRAGRRRSIRPCASPRST